MGVENNQTFSKVKEIIISGPNAALEQLFC